MLDLKVEWKYCLQICAGFGSAQCSVGEIRPPSRGKSEPSPGERLSALPARRLRHRRACFCRGHQGRCYRQTTAAATAKQQCGKCIINGSKLRMKQSKPIRENWSRNVNVYAIRTGEANMSGYMSSKAKRALSKVRGFPTNYLALGRLVSVSQSRHL